MAAHVLREGSPESVGMDPARIQKLRERVAGWVACGDTPSVVALVARRGAIVLHEAFGVRHFQDIAPTLRRDSIFPVASCTKPITAAAVLCLAEDGLIGLNRPFIDYVPELDVPGVEGLADAKVADLLCHTAGYDEIDLGAFVGAAGRRAGDLPPPAPGQHATINRTIRLAAGAPLSRRPGTAMVYSNFGYNLLGDIVRRVSGQPFWQFVRSRLFEPLGMRDSYLVLPPALRERRVYRAPGLPATQPSPVYGGIDSPERDELDVGSVGLAATALDLAVFMQMLLNRGSYDGRWILSPASVDAMTRNQVSDSIPSIMARPSPITGKRMEIDIKGGGYGYGLFIFGTGDRWGANGSLTSLSAFGHAGFPGCQMWADPECELVGVYLAVSPGLRREFPIGTADRFQNAVHAAIVD